MGQKVKNDYGANVVFEGDFAIHDKEHFRNLIEERKVIKGGNDFELYFEDNDVDAIADRLKSEGIQFIHEVKTQPWQQKVIRFYDPDLNIIEIGDSLRNVCLRLSAEGKSIEEIEGMTSLTNKFILDLLQNNSSEE